jgi:ATP-dependent Clp protease ATP-binding subunit ClpC
MTSNVGSIAIAKGRQSSIGFLTADDKSTSYAGMKALVIEDLKAYFCPELLNRIDEVVVFRPLERAQVCGLPLFVSSSAVHAYVGSMF